MYLHALVRWMLVLWASAGIAGAQTAALSGGVYDPSHAGVFNAAVSLVNDGTGLIRTTATGADGLYSFAVVAPGSYLVTVEASGFRKAERWGISLDVAESARLDFTLQLAATGESVSVSADASPVRSDSAAVSTVIDRQLIDALPLNGRSFSIVKALGELFVYLVKPRIHHLADLADELSLELLQVRAGDRGVPVAFHTVLILPCKES